MDEPSPEENEATAVLIGRGVAEVLRTEDFVAFREWVGREAPLALPRLYSGGTTEQGRRAGTNAIATSIWNISPLPSNAYRPRPFPSPGRNDPCPCGSGQKFKRCCGGVSAGFPAIGAEEMWVFLAGQATSEELVRLLSDPALPPDALGALAMGLRERGSPDGARGALARRLKGAKSLDARFEDALDAWLDLEGEARGAYEFIDFGLGLAEELPRVLLPAVWRNLLPAAIAARETTLVQDLLARLRNASPDDPVLGPLEVTALVSVGETARAAERSRFWLAWLRRRGLAEEMQEAVEMLEKTARDPEAAVREYRAAEQPFLAELATLLEGAAKRPVRTYELLVRDGEAVLDQPPGDVSKVEASWRRVWPQKKPFLVEFHVELPDSVIEEPKPWLDFLRAHPEAFDSLDVLDDLVLLAGPAAEELQGWDAPLLEPLLERGGAIVRASVAAVAGGVRLPWAFLANRSGLRLLSHLGYRLDGPGRADEAAAVYEEILRLNPTDNHGHRTWLVDHYLREGDDTRALAIAEQFPDDILPDTLLGRGLALWRLGRRSEAEEALRTAAADAQAVVAALVASEIREPEIDLSRITLGGEDEAWIYRQEMREVWLRTPDALEFLRGLPKPAPKRKRAARRRRPS